MRRTQRRDEKMQAVDDRTSVRYLYNLDDDEKMHQIYREVLNGTYFFQFELYILLLARRSLALLSVGLSVRIWMLFCDSKRM